MHARSPLAMFWLELFTHQRADLWISEQDRILPLTYTLVVNLTRWHSVSPRHSYTLKHFLLPPLPKCVPFTTLQPSPLCLGEVPGGRSQGAGLERHLRVMRKTHLAAHTAPFASAACVSLWERLKSTFFKILALKRNAFWAEMSAWLCPDHGTVPLLLTFWPYKTWPLPLHSGDGSWNWWNFNCIGFLSQFKDFTNAFLSFLFGFLPPHPRLKTTSYPEPVALDVQGSLCSRPWGQLSHIHFSPPFKKPIWASTSLAHSRLGQIVGGPAMSSSACLTAQLTAPLAELSLAELNPNSSDIILQLFSSLEILSFFKCIPTLFGNLVSLTSDLITGPLGLIA